MTWVPVHLVRVATRCLVATGLLLLLVVPLAPAPASAQTGGWVLTSFCTPAESYPAFRSFRVRNSTGAPDQIVLRNQSINQEITGTAPPGDSFWLVPAGPGTNTVLLLVNGVQVAVKASNNAVCAVLAGNALCDPATGNTTVTWTLRNNNTGPATIANGGGVTFTPNPVAANATSTGTQTLPPSTANSTVSLTVVVDLGQGVQTRPSATVNVGACNPPGVTSFTFTKAPSVTTAEVGQTVTYTYSGTNTGTIDLEVIGLVDDRLGVLITDPDVVTVVAAGGTISRTVTYVVKPEDAATTIVNNAVVVVRAVGSTDLQTAVATARVVVPEQVIVEPPQPPPTTVPGTTVPGTTVPGTTVPGALPATGDNRTTGFAIVATGLVALGLLARRAAGTS